MTKYWLIKTEPSEWGWQDQIRDKVTRWDGIRNYQARNNLRLMEKGDLCLFYHSIKEKQIVGIVKVIKEHYQDPLDDRFSCVDVEIYKTLNKPISLKDIKENDVLQEMSFVKQSRLSVSSVSEEEMNVILYLTETSL